MYSYRPTIPTALVLKEMAFETEEKCLEFLMQFSLTFTDSTKSHIDCKTSMNSISNL